jgi:cytochrome d ubiquinol oxidase subunit I
MLYSIPLPYLSIQLGWLLTEIGRQPWIVYGLIRTSDAVSPIAASQAAISLIGFVVVYSLLGIAGFSLIAKYALKGPDSDNTEQQLQDVPPEPAFDTSAA